jgi:hypothetical protein
MGVCIESVIPVGRHDIDSARKHVTKAQDYASAEGIVKLEDGFVIATTQRMPGGRTSKVDWILESRNA